MGLKYKPEGSVSHSSASTGGLKTAATVLAANGLRVSFTVQNQDTGVCYIKYGSGASTSDYHFVLKGCSVAADGTGGILSNDSYKGIVTCASNTTPSYTVAEEV